MKIFAIHAVNAIIHYARVAGWPPMITQNVKIVEVLTATMDVVAMDSNYVNPARSEDTEAMRIQTIILVIQTIGRDNNLYFLKCRCRSNCTQGGPLCISLLEIRD
jgi:hypothetical protein